MYKSVVARSHELQNRKHILQNMFRLRNTVFYERLGWQVKSHDQMEQDEYDDLNPVYFIAHNNDGEAKGCWRLLPTDGPYMLKDVFPELLDGEAAPNDPAVWELSRFATAPLDNSDFSQAHLSEVTFDMLRKMFDFCFAHDVERCVFVTSVALERLMRRIGLQVHRFGRGKPKRIGNVMTVACWVDVNEQTRQAIYGEMEQDQREAA